MASGLVMKVKTNDIESIRHINTIMVLNELRNSDHLLSRPNIADNLGLSKVTISNIARDLNDQSLTEDAGFGVPDSRGGRKPLLLALDRNTKRVLGARISNSTIEVSLCDITGRDIRNVISSPLEQDWLLATTSMVRDIMVYTNTSRDNIIGMVVLFDDDVEGMDGPDGDEAANKLARQLQEALGIREVRTSSFTRARAFAESWYKTQASKRRTSFFYVDLGMKLDCVAVRKSLLDPLPCEFGACHMTALPYGENGQCVTVDSLLSGRDLKRKAEKLLNREVTLEQLRVLAETGDELVLELLREYGYWLGCALALVVNMAGLRKIILGGPISSLWTFFELTMWKGIEGHVSENLKTAIKVQVIENRFSSGIIGAVALGLDWWVFRTDLLYDAMPSSIPSE
ncbi:hypothetical protein C4J81_03190 [Deltaproteobacteria bacterium Smac51]|nr:hypothetical protein C4J81_03190 [Deltaproteobacteria bacterium Smac51]